MTDAVVLYRSELLGFTAALYYECGGHQFGSRSPTLLLNQRSGRHWSAAQWLTVLEPHYERMVNPTPLDSSVHFRQTIQSNGRTTQSAPDNQRQHKPV